MNDKPNYYGIIPAEVRYSTNVSSGAKLLYCEITALTNSTGECWASNGYFAKLYSKSNDTISRWVSELEKAGFITVVVEKVDGTSRYISIVKDAVSLPGGLGKNAVPVRQKRQTGLGKNAEYNITLNNTNNKEEDKPKKTVAKKTTDKPQQTEQEVPTTTDETFTELAGSSEFIWRMRHTSDAELNAKLTTWAFTEIFSQLPSICAKHGKQYTDEQLQAWTKQQLTTDKVNVLKTTFSMYGEPLHSDTVKHLLNRANWQLRERGGLDIAMVAVKPQGTKRNVNYETPFK